MNSAMPCGIRLLALVPRAAGKQDRARRDAVDADVERRELLRQRLGQADLGGLDGVVGHPAAGLAAPDRRDHQDRAAAARASCAARRGARRGSPETASRRTPPATRRRSCRADPAPPARPTLLTRMSRPPNVSTVRSMTQLDAVGGRDVGLDRQDHVGPARRRFDFDRRFGQLLGVRGRRCRRGSLRPRARGRSPGPSPRLEPVTMATLSVSPRSTESHLCRGRPPVRSFRRQSNGWICHPEVVLLRRTPFRAAAGAAR